ncbi:AAA family ATPase [Patescibacteria group bacterium]|nr:AAA family ATPase [Patescibacteria group bacterium]MBU1921638.1 AAA family ATPase [Patescibacteria group bacterium]
MENLSYNLVIKSILFTVRNTQKRVFYKKNMYLEKIELQGFKTFAAKTSLAFLAPRGDKKGITAVVGPNGSGKSNISDAIRWAMGEQSIKLLRGKKSEDVIFSGSPKRARSGFAEVSLHLNNEDRSADIDYAEVVLTRRLYRDGQTEYYLNKNKARLQDIQLLLAQANFGPRTYSVIGQGMVDHILVASPQERKEFFDEAAGVKQFQIKRHSALNKLENSRQNLNQAILVINEIEPRLRSLSRLAKRLERREEVEATLHELQRKYYGTLWRESKEKIMAQEKNFNAIDAELKKASAKLGELSRGFEKLEHEKPRSDAFSNIQAEYQKLMNEKTELKEKYFGLQRKIDLAGLKQEKAPGLPIADIVSGLEKIDELQMKVLELLKQGQGIENEAKEIQAVIRGLLEKLREPKKQIQDPRLNNELDAVSQKLKNMDAELEACQRKMNDFNKEEESKRSKFFDMQKEQRRESEQVHALETRLNDVKIELAKLETRRDGLEQEMRQELDQRMEQIKAASPEETVNPDDIYPEMNRLKHQLELIGAIDEETMNEYKETKERYDYLKDQTEDLTAAIESLEKIIQELDDQIKTQSEASFKKLDLEFQKYFKILFGGGEAKLVQVAEEIPERQDEERLDEAEEAEAAPKPNLKKKKIVTGIEIQATPPGKRLKSINALSGGEMALTSIALICSIMANNPSPFVVLDEVDAALDESNSIKFANIIDELSKRTQFILITHNRATMNRARALYGVTMSEDGMSKMLSVKLEEAEKIAT